MIVSDVAGTTRDTIDTILERDGRTFQLVDTAGLRRKRKQRQGIDYYSELRALEAAERADVALVLIDASEGKQYLVLPLHVSSTWFRLVLLGVCRNAHDDLYGGKQPPSGEALTHPSRSRLQQNAGALAGLLHRNMVKILQIRSVKPAAAGYRALAAASTSSAWPSTLTLGQIWAILPFGPISTVIRTIPMKLLPYMDFLPQAP